MILLRTMRINPFYTFIITIAVCALVISVLVFGLVSMSLNVLSADDELAAVDAKINELYQERRRAETVGMLLTERKDDIVRLRGFFLDRQRPIEFIEQLENLARMTKNTIALGVQEGSKDTSSLSFRITVDGTQSSIRTFVRIFDVLPYSITISSVTFQNQSAAQTASGTDMQGSPARLTGVIIAKTL